MVSISALRYALMNADRSFRTLPRITWDSCPIVRSTHFAESRVSIDGKRMIIFMPLTPEALHRVERFLPLKRHLTSSIVPHLSLLRQEMRFTTPTGNEDLCDILLEPLHEGVSFDVALRTAQADAEYAADLLLAIEDLQAALKAADISLNNLREENLIYGEDGILRPIRWYYATAGAGNDDSTFEQLHSGVEQLSDQMLLRDIEPLGYNITPPNISVYKNHLAMAEGLIAIENEKGWGFMDCECNIVIPPQYLWVSKFCEGRAEVESREGMGLIDKTGRYIIPPQYAIVDYDTRSGNSLVYNGKEWAIFDYMGALISPFGQTEP